jgi:transcriptional regulator with XRE-family HTH domain
MCKVLKENIRAFRLKRGLTQGVLARRLGLAGRSTVSQWEMGSAAPRTEQLPHLADELQCSIDELFGRIKAA